MKRAKMPDKNRHLHTKEEERTIREAALDETIDASFPASDPPSSDPNPDDHDAVDRRVPSGNDPKPQTVPRAPRPQAGRRSG